MKGSKRMTWRKLVLCSLLSLAALGTYYAIKTGTRREAKTPVPSVTFAPPPAGSTLIGDGPTLSEALRWLSGASEEESADGNDHITFESDGCSATITETRRKAGPKFWVKESFSLTDIDPDDIQVENLATGGFTKLFAGQASIHFHTTNYGKKIIGTSDETLSAFPHGVAESSYSFTTNDSFAPRFAKALKHAVELCGGKRSAF
jgi:hypothetical protein